MQTILKIDNPPTGDKRIVIGWAYRSNAADGSPYVDASGEHIPFDELEMLAPPPIGEDTSGEMHQQRGTATVLGWYPLGPDDRQAFGMPPGDAGLMVKLRINDDALWSKVKSGMLPALSIEGEAQAFEIPK